MNLYDKLRAYFHNAVYTPPRGKIQWFRCGKCGFKIAWTFKDWSFNEGFIYSDEPNLPVCPYCCEWMGPIKCHI